MASTSGLSAWKKYFSGKGNVSTVTKKKSSTFLSTGKPGPIIDQGVTVIIQSITEKEYLSYVRGGKIGPKVNAYIPAKVNGKLLLCSLDDLAKPREGSVIDLKLQTVNLIAGAAKTKVDIMGYTGVESAVFVSAKELRKRVILNLQQNKLLDTVPAFKKSMIDYFKGNDSSKIEWLGAVSDGEKGQFAKYVGELVIGLTLLENKSVVSGTNPFAGKKIKEFIVPFDEGFPGADSLVRLKDGTLIPISSKSAGGAKASFFANILAPLFDHPEYFGNTKSVIKDIYTTAKLVGVASGAEAARAAKKIVYEYGVRTVLKIKTTELKNSYQLFEEFKRYDKLTQYSPPVRVIYNKLKNLITAKGDDTALKNLDSSTTVFFSKIIADSLNADADSMKIVMKVLGSKNYYQANMSLTSLKRTGVITFTMVLSGNATVNFIGTKSAYTNIDASQGTVNFELKRT